MTKRNDSADPERNVAVNSATDPQRPGTPSRMPPAKDPSPPGTTAAETTVPTDSATATHPAAMRPRVVSFHYGLPEQGLLERLKRL